jgi:hypothetical protein
LPGGREIDKTRPGNAASSAHVEITEPELPGCRVEPRGNALDDHSLEIRVRIDESLQSRWIGHGKDRRQEIRSLSAQVDEKAGGSAVDGLDLDASSLDVRGAHGESLQKGVLP